MLPKRSLSILKRILQGPITTGQLSALYKLSARTIRYDLETIDLFLREQDFPVLSRRGGISFTGDELERSRLLALTDDKLHKSDAYLPENRLYQIITILLRAEGFITTEDIAQMLDVSKSTVINDLNKLRSFYPYKSAKIEVLPRHGISFIGSEIDIRESIVSFLMGWFMVHDVFSLLQLGRSGKSLDIPAHIFQQSYLNKFAQHLRYITKTLEVKLPDSAFIRLLLYLSVTSARIQSGHFIEHDNKDTDHGSTINFHHAVKTTIDEMCKDAGVPSHSDECKHLMDLMADFFEPGTNNRAEIQILLLSLVKNIENALQIELLQDSEFIRSLDVDIHAIVENKPFLMAQYEEMEHQLLEHYSDVYHAVLDSVALVEDYVGRNLSKEEKIHMATLLVEAVQRNRTMSSNTINILVVTTGETTSRLLSYRLMSLFDVNIVDIIDSNQIWDFNNQQDVELIISTVPLEYYDVPVMEVSPFLVNKDLELLKSLLPTKVIDHFLLNNLMKIIESNCEIHNLSQLTEDIAELLRIKYSKSMEHKPSLSEILPLSNIELDVHCEDWEAAVSYAGNILYQNGYTHEGYTREMIEHVKRNGYYIVITDGVALPHAGLREVKKVGMALIRLANPVSFGHPHHDPVDLIFALCTPSKNVHLEALNQFSVFINNSSLLEKLRQVKDVEKIVDIIKGVEE